VRSFQDISIKWKLLALLLATSMASLLLVSSAIGIYEVGRIHHSVTSEAFLQAELVAAHSAGGLASGDSNAVQEALSWLPAQPEILDVQVFTAQGALAGEYGRNGSRTAMASPPPGASATSSFQGKDLVISCPVRRGAEVVGSVTLRYDLERQRARIRAYVGIGGVAVLAALFIASLLSLWVQRIISRPILRLREAARAVAELSDYSVRVTKEHNDEVGELVDGFNQMLDQVQRRRQAVRASEQRFRQLAESIREIFWMVDLETSRVLYVSPRYEEVWGRTCAKLYACPQDWHDGLHPDDRERVTEAFAGFARSGNYDEEFRVVQPGGAVRWIHARGFPVWDERGEIYRMAGIAEDTTHQKLLETQIISVSDHERIRIGQDLHDSVCQQLVRIAFAGNALREDLERQRLLPEAAAAARFCAMLDKTIDESCHLARGLCPIKVAGRGLMGALADMAEETTQSSGLACELDCPEPISVPNSGVAVHLYRIAQEAVNNALKHSQAKRIEIELKADANALHLRVADDGVGLPASCSGFQGMGLHIMAYRAQMIGGKLDIQRGSAGGTIARCSVSREALRAN
jgi:PAS domain S-box-containing protein